MSRFVQHPGASALADLMGNSPVKVLDSAAEEGMSESEKYVATNIALNAVATVQQWAETDDLDEGEGYGDRLMSMLVGIADADKNGELSDDEVDVFTSAAEAAWDYLSSKGVSDADIENLLNNFDNDVADRVRELLAERLPDGEDAAGEEMDAFAFGDGPAMDAVYKKVMAVRKGKKVRIHKRISGTVRLSAKQKLSIRKAVRKAHSAVAQMRRAKSMRIRGNSGLGK